MSLTDRSLKAVQPLIFEAGYRDSDVTNRSESCYQPEPSLLYDKI